MHFSSLIIVFAAASATVFGTPTQSTCVQYSCSSAQDQISCCSDTALSTGSTKSGCEPYVNNQAAGACDPSHIYCCQTLDNAAGVGIGCGPASSHTVKCTS